MAGNFPESDWKKFRKLREVALARFCDRTLAEIEKLTADTSASSHQRYLEIYKLIHERDRELAHAFNDPRRSRALDQLCTIYGLGLLEEDQIAVFSDDTRKVLSEIDPHKLIPVFADD